MALVKHMRAAEGRQLVVVGGRKDSVPGCTLPLSDGDTLCVGATTIRVLETPCHTRGHVLFCVLAGPAGAAGAREEAKGGGGSGCCGGGAAVAAAAPGAVPSARDADVEAVFSGATACVSSAYELTTDSLSLLIAFVVELLGDTVFVGGVGAFFHGNAADMERNLNGRMAGLPDAALLFCGYE